MQRVLFLGFGSEQQTTNMLFKKLADAASSHVDSVFKIRQFPAGVANKLRYGLRQIAEDWRLARQHDRVVVYASAALSLPILLACRLLGRPTAVFVWDIYPDSKVHASGGKQGLSIALHDWLERAGLRLASQIWVPSTDYLQAPSLTRHRRKVGILPLWPTLQRIDRKPQPVSDPVRVLFTGQVLASRGLEAAFLRLIDVFGPRVELHIYGEIVEKPSPAFDDRHRVICHGLKPQVELIQAAQNYDFALICLEQEYPLPAAPSKSLFYLSLGLPMLYFGPKVSFLDEYFIGKVAIDITRPEAADGFGQDVARLCDGLDLQLQSTFQALDLNWDKIAKVF